MVRGPGGCGVGVLLLLTNVPGPHAKYTHWKQTVFTSTAASLSRCVDDDDDDDDDVVVVVVVDPTGRRGDRGQH